jgi:uncharacterized RDD family membrane protein YckC
VIGLLCACFILLALGYTSAMWTEYHFAPELVAVSNHAFSATAEASADSDSRLLLFCRQNPALSSDSALQVYSSADGISWNHLARLPVSAGPAAVKDGELFLFHREDFPVISISPIVRGEKFEAAWRYSGRYEFSWSPIIALTEGDKIYLYGYEESEGGGKLREAVVEGESARETDFSYPLNSLAEISGCILGKSTYLFLRERGSVETQCIVIAGSERQAIKGFRFSGLCAFSAVSDGNSVYLFGSPRESEDKQSDSLVYYTLRGEEVSGPYEWEHNLRDIWGRKRGVVESSASLLRGEIFLCIRADDEIGVARFAGGSGKFERVVRMPLSARIALWGWAGSILSICAALVFFGVLLARKSGLEVVPAQAAHEPAPTLRRFLAFAIDLGVMLTFFLIASAPMANQSNYSLLELLGIDHPLILRFLALGYLALPEALFGQTVGKRVMGIIVSTEEGKKVTLWSAVLRNLFKLIYFLVIVEAVVALHTRRAQRLGDMTAGTVVLAKRKQ